MTTTRPVVIITFSDGIEGAHLQLLKDEKTALENTLWDLHAQELIEIYKEESMSRQELIDMLPRFNHDRIILFHYAGHAGSSGIYTEGGESRADGVAGLLGMEKSLQLVVLNGCSTMEQVKGLKERGVKAIVATSSPIGDEAAKTFATTFYKQLVRGRNLQDAFNYAIAATQTGKAIESHIQPMRAASFEDADEVDEIPWDLYYDEDHPEILEWTLPSPADPKENIDPAIYKSPEELQALSYPEKKGHLLKVLDNDLNRIIPDLDALLSSESEHRETVRLLNAQLNDYFRNKYSRAVSPSHLEADKKRIKHSLNHLVSMLENKDLATEVKPPAAREDSVQAPVENQKTGGIWRKIPPKMQLNRPTECKIKVAVDKSQLKQERAASDVKIRIDTIRTSNKMTVELFEPPTGSDTHFDIKLAGNDTQLVDFSEPTEWTFYVTPLTTGVHKLLLHITIAGEGGNEDLVKVIPLEEAIEVVDYQPGEMGVYEKAGLLKYLPYAAFPLTGPGSEQGQGQESGPDNAAPSNAQPEVMTEPASASTSTAAAASSSTATAGSTAAGAGLGIGKVLAGIVSLAALGGLGWWATQDNSSGTETAQTEPVQEEAMATPNPSDQTARVTAPATSQTGDSEASPQAEASDETATTEGSTSENLVGDDYDVSPTFDSDPSNGTNAAPLEDDEPFVSPTDNYVAQEAETDTAPAQYGAVNGPIRAYTTVNVAGVWWTMENLIAPGGVCYDENNSNCTQYGALYSWDAAQVACESLSPGNWRLPHPEEWISLQYENALPEMNLKKGGFAVDNGASSEALGEVGLYWSIVGEAAIEYTGNSITDATIPPEFMVSCRCVKD